jgi:hypothetical protein
LPKSVYAEAVVAQDPAAGKARQNKSARDTFICAGSYDRPADGRIKSLTNKNRPAAAIIQQ